MWSDAELVDMQMEVFKGELTPNDIRGIKEVIKEEVSSERIVQLNDAQLYVVASTYS